MQTKTVKDVMVPLSEYTAVSETITLSEAVIALEKAQEEYDKTSFRRKSILVYDESHIIVGEVGQIYILRGLEAGYTKIGGLRGVTHSGLDPNFIKSMVKKYGLWQRPLDEIGKKATYIKVKDIMRTPTDGEFIEKDTSLDEAIHQLITGSHQQLLVIKDNKIVGVLRLTDVFRMISQAIKDCRKPAMVA